MMKKTIAYFQEKPIRFVILVLVLLAIGALVFRLLTPEQPVVETVSAPKITGLRETTLAESEIVIDLTNIPIRDQYTVYSLTPLSLDGDRLAGKLQLRAVTPRHWMDTAEKKILSQDKYTHRFHYTNQEIEGDFDSATAQKINTQASLEIAERFVQQVLGISGLRPDLSQATFMAAGPTHPEESTEADANIIGIPFLYTIDEYPVYVGGENEPPVFILVDSTGKISGFTLSSGLFSIQSTTTVKAVSPDKLTTQLRSGNFSVIKIRSEYSDGFSLQNIQKVSSDAVTVQYRSTSNLLLPYYHISAKVKLHNRSNDIDVTFISPAVQTTP